MNLLNEHGIQIAIFEKNGDSALHGDVIITHETLPKEFESFEKSKDYCLAYGEVTGHAHRVTSGDFDLRQCPKTHVKYLRVITESFLKHEEHSPIVIPPGTYRIGIQREYDPFEKLIRKVSD